MSEPAAAPAIALHCKQCARTVECGAAIAQCTTCVAVARLKLAMRAGPDVAKPAPRQSLFGRALRFWFEGLEEIALRDPQAYGLHSFVEREGADR